MRSLALLAPWLAVALSCPVPCLAFPYAGLSQQATFASSPTNHSALIQYVYSQPPSNEFGSTQSCISSLHSPRRASPDSREPGPLNDSVYTNFFILNNIQDPCQFLLVSKPHAPLSGAGAVSFPNGVSLLSPDPTGDGHVRLFSLYSTFLLGSQSLNLSAQSFVVAQHFDSDPLKKGLNPPLFLAYSKSLQNLPGFEALQVWTWNQRQNHWTLITSWTNEQAYKNSLLQPAVFSSMNALLANSAAPQNLSFYRLMLVSP